MLTGLVLIALAAISWGTTGATMTLLAQRAAADPLLVGFARLAIAAPFLLGAALVSTRNWRLTTGRDALALLVMGGAMAAYQVFYFRAVTLTGVAVAALLAICSSPLMIAGLAALFLRERLTAATGVSLAMAVAGTALLVIGPRGLGEISSDFALGAVLALGAGLSYAMYTVIGKGTLARVSPLPLAGITFTVAALTLSPVLLSEHAVAEPLAKGWPLFLYLGLIPTALAYGLFTVGLRRIPATVAGITTLLEPLTASALGVFLFGERLGAAGTIGAILLLAAIALLTARRN
ncbi:MAG: DMT family transporter [candidate division NC10 bacterium]